jgi:hypothetical protein
MIDAKKIASVALQIKCEPVMHKTACKHCPSTHYPLDPEAADILLLPKSERIAHAFPCAWFPQKYCRGNCLQMGITDQDLAASASHLSGCNCPTVNRYLK